MAYKTKVFLGDVLESIDSGIELFMGFLQKAKIDEDQDKVNRYEGAIEALNWAKRELGHEIKLL